MVLNFIFIKIKTQIPFEKNVPIGFHDILEDHFSKEQIEKKGEEKRRFAKELEDRKKDRDKLKKRKQAFYDLTKIYKIKRN